MSIESAREGLDQLAAEHHMLYVKDGQGRDLEVSVVYDEIRCYYPDPAQVPEEDRESVRDSFYEAILELPVRPSFKTAEDVGQDISSYPTSVRVVGTGDYSHKAKSIEVVCACDKETAEECLIAWVNDGVDP